MTVSRVRFKRTDLELSLFVAGCWRLVQWQKTQSELETWIKSCIDLGVTTFDHADVYGGGQLKSRLGRCSTPSCGRESNSFPSAAYVRPKHRNRTFESSTMTRVRGTS